MKLLHCTKCGDVFKLDADLRTCRCGRVEGRYLGNLHAEYRGDTAVPLGITNSSLTLAIRERPNEGQGKEFTAFVIPHVCPTMRKV